MKKKQRRAIWRKKLILFFIFFLFFVFFDGNIALADGTMHWSTDFDYYSSYASARAPIQSTTEDISIVGITLNLTGLPQGVVAEACFSQRRNAAPSYDGVTAGYSEVMCWNATRWESSQNWQVNIDLTDTPIYSPKNTIWHCGANVVPGSGNLGLTCDLTYRTYENGMPRYRMLRFPYTDMVVNADGSIPTSYYVSSTVSPLHIKGFNIYNHNTGPGATAKPCLKWVKQGGSVFKQRCVDLTFSGNYNSASSFQSTDWTLPAPDLLTATCQNSSNTADCAIYALAEIPADLKLNYENAFRDYNNVPHPYLNNWCTQYVGRYGHTYYCTPNPSNCTSQTKINQCVALYPAATCISSGSCKETTQPDPEPEPDPNPDPNPNPNPYPDPGPDYDPSTGLKSIYRFWSPSKQGHFYTSSLEERNSIIANDTSWQYEGIAYTAYSGEVEGLSPVFRFWSDSKRHHFYTISESEKNNLITNDPSWKYEGIAYYAHSQNTLGALESVYRFWSQSKQGHFFTSSLDERNQIIATDPSWKYEGIGWYIPAD